MVFNNQYEQSILIQLQRDKLSTTTKVFIHSYFSYKSHSYFYNASILARSYAFALKSNICPIYLFPIRSYSNCINTDYYWFWCFLKFLLYTNCQTSTKLKINSMKHEDLVCDFVYHHTEHRLTDPHCVWCKFIQYFPIGRSQKCVCLYVFAPK